MTSKEVPPKVSDIGWEEGLQSGKSLLEALGLNRSKHPLHFPGPPSGHHLLKIKVKRRRLVEVKERAFLQKPEESFVGLNFHNRSIPTGEEQVKPARRKVRKPEMGFPERCLL